MSWTKPSKRLVLNYQVRIIFEEWPPSYIYKKNASLFRSLFLHFVFFICLSLSVCLYVCLSVLFVWVLIVIENSKFCFVDVTETVTRLEKQVGESKRKLEDYKSEDARQSRQLEDEAKTMEKLLNKRSVLLQKKEETTRKVWELVFMTRAQIFCLREDVPFYQGTEIVIHFLFKCFSSFYD